MSLYSFDDGSAKKSTIALFSIVFVALFTTGLQTHFVLSIAIFACQMLISQTYLWLQYGDAEGDKSLPQHMIIVLSLVLIFREILLSLICFCYERSVYAFFHK